MTIRIYPIKDLSDFPCLGCGKPSLVYCYPGMSLKRRYQNGLVDPLYCRECLRFGWANEASIIMFDSLWDEEKGLLEPIIIKEDSHRLEVVDHNKKSIIRAQELYLVSCVNGVIDISEYDGEYSETTGWKSYFK